ncbi:MAG TPA: gluconate 2-dehydrogenase subunit 3 family protein [Pseudolabrys sp.]|nr:gluconate 2-dehydrogenase subunit 3 family protein [Pseudolabrys sp.]
MSKEFTSLYPNYDVLKKWDTPSWNDITRAVIEKRLNEVPRRRFFTERQWVTLVAVCDRVMPQPDRSDPVPIAPWIDTRVYERQGTGTHYASLPPQQECWRHGMDAIEAEAQHRHRRPFDKLDPVEQDLILHAIEKNEVGSSAWDGLPSQNFFRHILLRAIVEVYYAHPAAWSEIGFGGPASPRGYVRLPENRRDPWEAEEHAAVAAQRLAAT